MVPVDLALAVYAMWASLLLSIGFAVVEWFASASPLDPAVRLILLGGHFVVIRAIPQKHRWARYASVGITLVFFLFLARDADGLTRTDIWHMLIKAPIDVFVISSLFKASVSQWLREP